MGEHRLEGQRAQGQAADLWDEVCRLRAENERLRAALQPFADYAARVHALAHPDNPIGDACPPADQAGSPRNAWPLPTLGDCRRAALVRELDREPPARAALTLDALRQLAGEKGGRP